MDWIKWLNPGAPINSEAEALSAGRASAVSLFVGVLYTAFGVVWSMTAGKAAMDAALAQAAVDTPEAAGLGAAMAAATVGVSVITIVIQAVCGFVQWRWTNIVIPIIFAILVVIGLGSTVLGLLAANASPEVAAMATSPMWLSALSIIIMIAQLLWHITGARGASALKRFREAAPVTDDLLL